MKKSGRRIAIVIGPPLHFVKEEAATVAEEAQTRFGWGFDFFELGDRTLDEIQPRKLDGAVVIGLHEHQAYLLRWLAQKSIPTVHIGEAGDIPGVVQITVPNSSIGSAGARHLIERGHRRFAYFGVDKSFSHARRAGFAEAVRQGGFGDTPALMLEDGAFASASVALSEFLAQLPKPIGVMACNDVVGMAVTRAADDLGIDIPEQLAIVSVDNEELLCALATPPLSSIHFPTRAVGRQAATVLDDLMHGRPGPASPVAPPLQVVERQSSAVVHAGSPQIAAAIRFLRRHFADGAAVDDAATFAGISRSTLERGFRQTLGRSAFEELTRLRFQAVKELLATSDLPIKVIAQRCGFSDHRHLTIAFRTAFGIPPTQFRLQPCATD